MYNKILIISDNAILCRQFEELLFQKKFKHTEWTFSVSNFSDINNFQFRDKREVKRYNLKSSSDIDEIINAYDLVFSLHCKQIFPPVLINAVKCINIHPGYNPINRGWYPHIFSILHNLPIGVTIHEIDSELDHGNIIDREFVDKYLFDTGETLYNRIIKKEMELLERNIENIIDNNYKTIEPESGGNLFFKKNFDDLKEINLDEHSTMLELINRLRSLTHSEYDNAYFIDPSTGKKIFVSLNLRSEDVLSERDKK